ncbi:aspartate/glutamate racemase family protein [Croceicoccus marinus]|uniref:Amino acid racemase n=1 Tax=Croceicoccus marinus TaxID=450378 RepID=A0A7G6VWR5_9SPHN|nr:amino acid racemase [Croceicoccus marinus]QNE06180.1 amino acid racemase [Croceicoccus marinus]
MRKLGLIGGMSWVSTRAYYEDINQIIQRRVSPTASAPLLIESIDFSRLYRTHGSDQWDHAAQVLIDSARRLENAGAGALVIAANSMHAVYDRVAEAVGIPVIHIADCVAARMTEKGIKRAALLGTRNVMMEDFYRERLVVEDIELLPPNMDIVETLDTIIYDELMHGKVRRDSERELRTMITNLEKAGAEAVVMACTELDLLIDTGANVLPIFDSGHIHAAAAADWIIGEDAAQG